MNTRKTMKLIVSALILIIGIYFSYTYNIKKAYAASNPSGLTGQYGCMLNLNGNGYGALWQGQTAGINLIWYLDYANNTSKGMITNTENFNTTNVVTTTNSFSSTFSETAVSGLTQVYKIEHAITNKQGVASSATLIGIIVNSGNTILVNQTRDGEAKAAYTGVCQKI